MTEENNNPAEEAPNQDTNTDEDKQPKQATESNQPKPSFFTRLTIRVLRGIIARLENTVEKLEASSPAETETAALEAESQPAAEELRGWNKILRQVRDRAPIAESLPDFLLTTILVGGTIAIVWGAVAIIPEDLFQSTPSPSPEQEVAEQPEQPEKPEAPIPPPEAQESEPEIITKPKRERAPEIETEPELTPEQGLIAAIQDQVSEITTRYAEGLIESIEANFQDGRLIIAVSNDWFELSTRRQDELSKEMLARSRKLDFTKLVLTTVDGQVLARSPVVGEKMVILQREQPSPTSTSTKS
ncbi:MAG: hypothetical protein BRC33_05480 [Cyanobacteria bacterium SW_9_44_58]|nr:MAG: hypothetical protein BRC33_05480 [Cyanobacteria bacterium SW_9_44_58]